MLTAVPITTDSKDFKEIKHLYIAAFPKSERVPLRDLLRHDGASEFVAGYDGETFCGFYSALTFGDITHILFLAIDASHALCIFLSEIQLPVRHRALSRRSGVLTFPCVPLHRGCPKSLRIPAR